MSTDSDNPEALDAIDLRLLALLQADASRSNQALAEAAHVSPATALRRVRRLVVSGVIERQVAIVAPARVGGLSVIVEITLDRQGAEHVAAFEARAVAEAHVQQCYRVSPGPDLVLVLWLPDMVAYHALVQRLFTQDANVRNVKSYFATHRAKFAPAVTLAPGTAGESTGSSPRAGGCANQQSGPSGLSVSRRPHG